MKLADLAFACYIYSRMTDFDSSYRRFLEGTRPHLDPQLKEHQESLLTWLNQWGCRQFSKACYGLAAQQVAEWHKGIDAQIFPLDKDLLTLTDSEFDLAGRIYGALVDKTACKRRGANGSETTVTVGPTGAAKILFALRPHAFPPWDRAIRDELGFDGSAGSYSDYLRRARKHMEELRDDCNRRGICLADLPQALGRPLSSIAKLIDEYFWVTVSRKCPAPSEGEITRWTSWR